MSKPICVLGHYSLEQCRRHVVKRYEPAEVKKETLTECECDHCSDDNCSCRGKRCDFCKEQDNA